MRRLDRITISPRICMGQPSIRGMRITVSVVLKLLAEGKITEEQRGPTTDLLMHKKVEWIYDTYHARLPEMKTTVRDVSRTFEQRGYVRNLYGRRLAGIPRLSYMAFNKIVQSTAAEIFKDRTVALSPRYCKETRERDTYIVASVHDSLLFDMPVEHSQDKEYIRWLRQTMCETQRLLRVPLRASAAVSTRDWCEAAKDKVKEKECKEWLGPYETPCLPFDLDGGA